jgi:hypothetical protein
MNWNAWLAEGFLDALQSGNKFQTGSFADLVAAYSTLASADLAAFASEATALGLIDFAFGYGYITNIPAGLQLFFGAHACHSKSIIGTAPYNTNPNSWVASDITGFAADLQNA